MPLNGPAWAKYAAKWHAFVSGSAPVSLTRIAPEGAAVLFKVDAKSQSPKLTEAGVIVFDTLTGWAMTKLTVGDQFSWDGQTWRVSDDDYYFAGSSSFPHRYTLLGRARGPREAVGGS